MSVNLVLDFVLSALDLVKGAIIISIIVFLLTLLALLVFKRVKKWFGWGWFKSVFLTTFVIVFVLSLIFYFVPLIFGFATQTVGAVLPELQYDLTDFMFFGLSGLINVLVFSIIVSFLLLPLEFVGIFVFDYLKKKSKNLNYFITAFISVFVATLIASVVIFFLLPWTLSGLVYFLYFGFF